MTPQHTNTFSVLLNWVNRLTTKKALRRVGKQSLAMSTDIGSVRQENQDKCIVMRKGITQGQSIMVAVICDGMGGMEAGSDCASKAASSFISYCANSPDHTMSQTLNNAVKAANDIVYSEYEGRGGATLSAIGVDSNGEVIGINVGDSRIYSYTSGKLIQLSKDDTLEGQLQDSSGIFTGRKELLQHVGVGPDIEPHIIPIQTINTSNGSLLLCTDGVHFLGANVMSTIFEHASEPAVVVMRLTELSSWFGGKDNATSLAISSYDSLVRFRDESKTDVLEVWDPFGELQLHFQSSNKNVSFNQESKKDDSAILKPKQPKKKRKPRIKKEPDLFKTEADAVEIEKPKLKVEFVSDQGE